MELLEKIKKFFIGKDANKLIFKINKHKINKYKSISEYPIKLSDFIKKGGIGCNFYIVSYKCPCCKSNPLYKTMFPIGKEYKITTTIGFIYMEEVFTCPNCYTVFIPLQDEKFDYGEMFTMKLDNEKEYLEYLLPLNIFGEIGECT